jgi:hypothetical protein
MVACVALELPKYGLVLGQILKLAFDLRDEGFAGLGTPLVSSGSREEIRLKMSRSYCCMAAVVEVLKPSSGFQQRQQVRSLDGPGEGSQP